MKISVNISEKELEESLLKKIPEYYPVKIIKNQYETNSGIIDILAKSTEEENVYFIFEIKVKELTTDSVCQVLKYTQYMNSEKSKNGKRRFYPVLVGRNLEHKTSNDNLFRLVKKFNGFSDNIFYVQYFLYEIGLKGIELDWFDKKNKKFIEENYKQLNSHIGNVELERDDLIYNLENAKLIIKKHQEG